jgi:sugar diacid utilization regulator
VAQLGETRTVLAEPLRLTQPPQASIASPLPPVAEPAGLAQARGALRDLRGVMFGAVGGGGAGMAEVARLASVAVGAPIAIVVPDLATVVVPAATLDAHECERLEHWVRERVRGRPTAARGDVVAEVAVSHGGRMVGVVAMLGDDERSEIEPLAPWVLDTAGAAAVMAVAVEQMRIDTEHRLRGSFLEQLHSKERLEGPEIARRAARLGCDVSAGAVLLRVEVESNRPGLVALTIADEHPGAFAEPIESDAGVTQVWAILPAVATTGDSVVEATQAAAKRLATRLRQHGAVGLSRFHSDPAEFTLALDEAGLMLDVMRKVAVPPGEEIVDGTYKLLFRLLASHPDELSNYHAATIAPLVQHDNQYRTDLVPTLEAYLETNCNMNMTADAIFAHRHTVAHRLDRICELTGLDPTIHEDREQLGLGLKIHRLTS